MDRKDSLPSFAVVKYKDDTLVNTGKKWTQFPAQNLSAVLNDPRRNVREIDFFTRVWGESFVPHAVVPLTLLPNTPKSYFDEHWKKYEFVCFFLFPYCLYSRNYYLEKTKLGWI